MINTSPTGLKLMLPWPDPVLNPNQRKHWAVKKDAKRAAKQTAFAITYNTGVKLDPEKNYQVDLIFCPPNRSIRDLDNLQTSMKAALDGMCRALGIDDKMIRPVPDWGPVVQGGKVEITIVERETLKNPQSA